MTNKEKLESAEAEVARLENIVRIQQKQIERLMDERDILRLRITTKPDDLTAKMEAFHEGATGWE